MKLFRKSCLIVGILISLLGTGCKTYKETFVKYNSDGSTNHVFKTTYHTWFIIGRAAELRTSTQTEDYIRTVSADSVSTQVDAQAIEAAGGAVGAAVGSALKTTMGKP